MNQEAGRGTRASSPDLDWSQVRETVLMLELAAGQVDAAMRDSNASVNTLMDTFTSMADTLSGIDAALAALPDADAGEALKAGIRGDAQQVAQKVHQAIIAFQFYDKLVQRLDHVCHSLGGLSALVGDRGRLYDPQQWTALQEQIRSKYTMAEERTMFDAVMAGATVQDALQAYMATRMQEVEDSGGDIELF